MHYNMKSKCSLTQQNECAHLTLCVTNACSMFACFWAVLYSNFTNIHTWVMNTGASHSSPTVMPVIFSWWTTPTLIDCNLINPLNCRLKSNTKFKSYFLAELRRPKGPPSRAPYRNRITCMHRNRNPCNSFLMVKMASGMDHGCVGPTTTTTSRNMAAIQLIPSHAVLDYSIYMYLWY